MNQEFFCPKCGDSAPPSAAFCRKCGESLTPATPPQVKSRKRTFKEEFAWIIWLFGWNKSGSFSFKRFCVMVFVVAFIGSEITHSPNATPMPDSTASAEDVQAVDTPTPVDSHARRATAQEWYLRVVNQVSLTRACVTIAGDFIEKGDSVNASAILKRAIDTAAKAASAANDNTPEGWSDVQGSFFSATNDLKDAVSSLRSYLDNQEPSSAADSKDKVESSAESFRRGVQQARSHYVAMGGKSDDLSNGSDMTESTIKLLRSMEN